MSDIAFRFMAFGLPLEIVATIVAILAGLVVASLFTALRRVPRDNPDAVAKAAELKARIRTWWVMVLILVVALLLGRTAMIVLFAFVSYLALKEYLSLVPTRKADRVVLLIAYLAVPVQYYWVGTSWYGMFVIFVPVYMFLILPAAMVLRGETGGFLKAAGTLHWGLMIAVFAISHAAFLIAVPPPEAPEGTGAGLLLFLLITTEFNDVAQFIAGKSFGRRKITPKVSPNKTVEGFLGGIVATTLLAFVLAPWLTPIEPLHGAMIGAMIAAAGFVGDIVMSAMKRDLGVKDTGTMLPGHGGMLDRIDSLVFTAPLFFHTIRYFYF